MTSSNITQAPSPMYRPDIDGLRAVAVLLVVLYHAFPKVLRSGFIGVDIFFVISGYLISSIILRELARGSFSFADFYARRIRRIFPALLTVLAASFVFGWVSLLADEYMQLGKHIAGGMGFVSNFILWSEIGYFDNNADTKPLLHLWSLSIEEQFYLLWPFWLWLVAKTRIRAMTAIAVVLVLSFAANMALVRVNPSGTFYWPHTRFWELLLGAALAAYPSREKTSTFSNALSLLGLALLVVGLSLIKKSSHFPGSWALLPTLAAVCFIAAGPQGLVNRWLGRPAVVWVGLISFPLYLWHWPLLSFARILRGDNISSLLAATLCLLSLILSYVTYRFIETPIRFGQRTQRNTYTLALVAVLFGTIGLWVNGREGLPFRSVVQVNDMKKTGLDGGDEGHIINECGVNDKTEKAMFDVCAQDSRETPRLALIGDSKAAAIYQGLIRTSEPSGRWLVLGGYHPKHGAPIPLVSDNPIYRNYQKLASIATRAIFSYPTIDTVVVVAATRAIFQLRGIPVDDLPTSPNYEVAYNALRQGISTFVKAGKKVVLVVDNPTLPNPEDCLARETSIPTLNVLLTPGLNPRCRLALEKHLSLTHRYRQLLNEVQKSFPDAVSVFDTTPYLCEIKEGVCLPHRQNRTLYSYVDHISDYAAGMIGKDLNPFVLALSSSGSKL